MSKALQNVIILHVVLIAWIIWGLSGCATPLDPVQRPPLRFQHSTTATVEFVDHPEIACAARGAIFAGACSDRSKMTVQNPCQAWPASKADERECHELAHFNGWPADHKDPPVIPLASTSPQALALQ